MALAVTLNPCVDRTIFVKRLELGKIVQGTHATAIAGGKGLNVARLVRRLGEAAESFAVLGGHPGRMIEELSRRQDGIELIAVWTEAPTRDIVTIVEEGTHFQAAFKEPSPRISADERERIVAAFEAVVSDHDPIAFMGSAPCREMDEVYRRMIEIAKNAGRTTILDSSGPALLKGIEAAPFMVKPNLAETAGILGCELGSSDQIWKALDFYRNKGIEWVVLTDGENGAYVDMGGRRWRVEPPAVKTVNPVASGDSLVAGVVVGRMRKLPMEETIRLGVACGAANAAMWEPSSCSPEVVERLAAEVRLIRVPA